MRQRTLFMVTVALMCCATLSAQTIRRDGNWWLARKELEKSTYLIGFLDGLGIGALFAELHVDAKCVTAADKSFNVASSEYFGNVVVGQISDGLDVFYRDFRNCSITMQNGIWVVARQIAGTPASEITEEIERLRREAH